MTSSTRSPTCLPTSPWSQPGMTEPSPIAVVKAVLRVKEESKFFPVFQSTPVYCISRVCPLVTVAPVPWISTFVTRPAGGLIPAGIFTAGFPAPGSPATLGSEASVCAAMVPVMSASAGYPATTSSTKTSTSVGPTPAWELPWLPKASAGGATTSIRLPAFAPVSAVFQADKRGTRADLHTLRLRHGLVGRGIGATQRLVLRPVVDGVVDHRQLAVRQRPARCPAPGPSSPAWPGVSTPWPG